MPPENWNEAGTHHITQNVLANGIVQWIDHCTRTEAHTTILNINPQKRIVISCNQKITKAEIVEQYRKEGRIDFANWIEKNASDNQQTEVCCSTCVKKNCDQAIKKNHTYVSIQDNELATYDPKLLFHEHGLGEWKTDYPMHPILRKHRGVRVPHAVAYIPPTRRHNHDRRF
jgi:hypothetical protein